MKGMKIMMALLLISTMLLNSCKKGETTTSMYSVRMTDAPAPYSQVNVDIQGVEVIGTNGTTAMLNVHAGTYNLLSFANGMDTLIAWGNINVGTVSQVKLILGSNNSVMANGTIYPISIPTGMDSGLRLAIHQTLESGANTILLIDFDANQSIVAEASGSFHLAPVIRPVNLDANASGSITGHIATVLLAAVTITGNGNTYSTSVASDGYFKIKGLATGTYNVTVTPAFPLQPVTISNVTVTSSSTTDIGLVAF